MYRKYKASLISKSDPGSKGHSKKDKGGKKSKGSSSDIPKVPKVKQYFYGKDRKKPNFWERDLEFYKKFINRWKDKANEDSPSNGPTPPTPPPEPVIPKPPPRPAPPPEVLEEALHVTGVDFHIDENTKKHRTDKFSCTEQREDRDGNELDPELVVRRGDSMDISISFDRPYNKASNEMQLVFSIGDKPSPSRGTLARLFVDESGNENFKHDKWGAALTSKKGNDVTISVHIPFNCIIGEWNMTVKLFSEDEDGCSIIWQYTHDDDFTILFNPWCKHDGVYMEETGLLKEYILLEDGCVYRGNAFQRGAKPWNFGQFDPEILDVALTLVRCGFRGGVSRQMADPVMVSRNIAKMINACDDSGVLVGNWSGNYEGGESPSKWGGSIKILKRWRKDGCVKFGQCWVFSCLTTTVCRALGIPVRTVTNFASAHDTNASNCIECFYRDRAKNIKDEWRSGDSVWNFHVWNEVWMTRPDLTDLDEEFEFLKGSGWQVIDATPQELSEGVYTCGPAPVEAVKHGYCLPKYDTDFVFAEVNADRVTYELQANGEYKRTEVNKYSVGKCISTKIPDGRSYDEKDEYESSDTTWAFLRDTHSERKRLDITLNYKFPEGSKEERESIMRAQRTARNPFKDNYAEEKEQEEVKPVEFHLKHSNNTMIGSEMKIQFTAKNDGDHDRTILAPVVTVAPKSYTGETANEKILTKEFGDFVLKKGEETSLDCVLSPADYLEKLIEHGTVSIMATAQVVPVEGNKNKPIAKEHDVRFRRPDLEVTGPKTTKKGKEVNFEVTFENPLDKELTECDISMESAGFRDIDDEKLPNIEPRGVFKKKFCVKANKKIKDYANVSFIFDSKELKDISGSCSIKIEN